MSIEVTASVVVSRPRMEAFQKVFGDPANFARYFKGYPPLIPGVVGMTMDGGAEPGVGATRTVKLSDGSQIRERITAWEPGVLHDYEMAEMNTLQRLLVTNMVAAWRFGDEGGDTRVTWRYAFFPRDALRRPLVKVMAGLFRTAMQRCLDNVARG